MNHSYTGVGFTSVEKMSSPLFTGIAACDAIIGVTNGWTTTAVSTLALNEAGVAGDLEDAEAASSLLIAGETGFGLEIASYFVTECGVRAATGVPVKAGTSVLAVCDCVPWPASSAAFSRANCNQKREFHSVFNSEA